MPFWQVAELVRSHVRERFGPYVAALCCLGLGMVLGALAVGALNAAQRADLLSYLGSFVHALGHGSMTPPWVMRRSLADNIKELGLATLLGVSVLGVPLAFGMLLLQGLAVGFAVGFLIQELGFRGLTFALVGVAPSAAFALPALVLVVVGSLGFAHSLWRSHFFRSRGSLAVALWRLSGMLTAATCALLMASLMGSYLSPWLIRALAGYLG